MCKLPSCLCRPNKPTSNHSHQRTPNPILCCGKNTRKGVMPAAPLRIHQFWHPQHEEWHICWHWKHFTSKNWNQQSTPRRSSGPERWQLNSFSCTSVTGHKSWRQSSNWHQIWQFASGAFALQEYEFSYKSIFIRLKMDNFSRKNFPYK